MTNQKINEAVARKLGWTEDNPQFSSFWRDPSGVLTPSCDVPDYCTDFMAAWEILTHVRAYLESNYALMLTKTTQKVRCVLNGVETEAYTVPMAICLAFLKTAGK